jgi:hypothetical protein
LSCIFPGRSERFDGRYKYLEFYSDNAMQTLQKFAAAHASIHNHFNHDRHLNRRDIFKQNRSVALAEWRQLAA